MQVSIAFLQNHHTLIHKTYTTFQHHVHSFGTISEHTELSFNIEHSNTEHCIGSECIDGGYRNLWRCLFRGRDRDSSVV
ncbi:unnamed protein product [Allacma fusca]|uniref:Uncharacterized protein n=1 Tax=Allacma fusca TaxID=39272 RepID=A0A8J2M611_9HEXA|nr:unnamed protein product [Allacma fusca]